MLNRAMRLEVKYQERVGWQYSAGFFTQGSCEDERDAPNARLEVFVLPEFVEHA